jgi:hypothetical protein
MTVIDVRKYLEVMGVMCADAGSGDRKDEAMVQS